MKKVVIPIIALAVIAALVGGYHLYRQISTYVPTYQPSAPLATATPAPAVTSAPAVASAPAADAGSEAATTSATAGKYAQWVGDWTLESAGAENAPPGSVSLHGTVGSNGLPSFQMILPDIEKVTKDMYPRFPNLSGMSAEPVNPPTFKATEAINDSTVKCVIAGQEDAPMSIEATLNSTTGKLEMVMKMPTTAAETQENKLVFGKTTKPFGGEVNAVAALNFKEALLRSATARAKADMRSLATGLEAYFVDNNKYPEPRANNTLSLALTTPIAYITGFMADPFAPEKGASYQYYMDKEAPQGWMLLSGGPDGDVDVTYDAYSTTVKKSGRFDATPADFQPYAYDPTNGSISSGDIFRIKQ